MLPGLRGILERAAVVDTQPATNRTDGIVAFHWLETTVQVDARTYAVGIFVREDALGHKFYNLTEDLQRWRAKYKTPGRTREREHGAQGSEEGEPDGSTFLQSVPPDTSGINLHIAQAETGFQQSAGDEAKGSITFGRGQIDIRLLEGADFSTFIHETGHLYLNELIDDATTAGTAEQLWTDLDTVLAWMGIEIPGQL